MVIGKDYFVCERQPRGLETGQELFRTCDATERYEGLRYVRRFHDATKPPDGAQPSLAKFCLKCGIICRDGENIRALDRPPSLAKISCGQEVIAPVIAIYKKNVDIAKQLPMLKAIIEDMDPGLTAQVMNFRLGEAPCLVAFLGNKDRYDRLTRDQQGLVSELLGIAVEADLRRLRAFSAVAARKHIDLESARRK